MFGAPYPLPDFHPCFDFEPIPTTLTLRTLKRFSISKACSDLLLSNHLREWASSLCASLSYLFNLSLSMNVFPSEGNT